ncbi:agmatine deiminase family protein [Nocardioides sp. GY 10127]|uniref:agmatine deiminase family protein n=1 Tax=Nocardioides sp. GY 10127 TaxID=2569762 RepID=UPI0010A8A658|nr:agmatine deiminase family protein [Nocardioides sp. GY 10127]TIC80007.1 agmatine deiminase family protein [Nocardioides sp. GY 10127]
MTWRMPAETAPHTCTWMAWPSHGYALGETAAEADEARAAWAAVAHAVSAFEPVRMVVDPVAVGEARKWLSADVELLEAPLDDAWMRDIGPTFVIDDGADGSGGGTPRLGAVDWVFNGWGAQAWARWERDARIGRFVAEAAGAVVLPSSLVNEGGGIHVDGAGTVLATRTVQLDPGRNPGLVEADVEAELRARLGVDRVVWLPRGLTRDYEELGTRGHVDIVATMPEPGVVLLHAQRSPEHPDHAVTAQVRDALSAGLPADWRLVDLPAPAGLRDEPDPATGEPGGFVDHSYVNHHVVNGGVVACAFDDPGDAVARDVLAEAYPGREVVSVDARPIFARGGGIHCITQQQPALP